jgi:hypothetical protein
MALLQEYSFVRVEWHHPSRGLLVSRLHRPLHQYPWPLLHQSGGLFIANHNTYCIHGPEHAKGNFDTEPLVCRPRTPRVWCRL